jgi:hypothetical protein
VITGGIGICHLYVDQHADLARALPVIRNAKVQRPTVCNALDTVLVHRPSPNAFCAAPGELLGGDGVELCAATTPACRWPTPFAAAHACIRPARRLRHRMAGAGARHAHRRRCGGRDAPHRRTFERAFRRHPDRRPDAGGRIS